MLYRTLFAAAVLAAPVSAQPDCVLGGPLYRSLVHQEPFRLALEDLDGDADRDFVFSCRTVGKLGIMILDASTFEVDLRFIDVREGTNDIAIADFDGDGDADIAMANRSETGVGLLLNTGDGTFDAEEIFETPESAWDILAGDLDNDGDVDILAIGAKVTVLLNQGDGSFVAGQSLDLPEAPHEGVLGDLDGDGDLDVALAIESIGVIILLNNGDGVFVPGETLGGVGWRNLDLCDLDGDADLEIVVAREDAVQTYLNNGDATFVPGETNFFSGQPLRVLTGDLDGDSHPDLVVAYTSSTSMTDIFMNQGDGTLEFTYRINHLEVVHHTTLGDLDDDGDLDYAIALNRPWVFWRTNECGPFCEADLDDDGDVDAEDFFAFLDLFSSGDDAADIDRDGDIDAEDFFAYLDLFAAGC